MTEEKDVLFQVTYGSKLYGTSTPTSDTDLKSVYLPSIDDMLLGKRLVATKTREFADGRRVPDKDPMPENGVENEFIPFQTFVRDFVQGQTYAVEMAHAILKSGPEAPDARSHWEFSFVEEMVERFANAEVYSMVGFAMKQTLDYVKRGERLNEATKVQAVLLEVLTENNGSAELRLDTTYFAELKVLDYVSQRTGLPLGTTVNNNRTLRTLELNGRQYTEATTVDHLMKQVEKLVSSYGERSARASEVDVDWKSLSHAVRVYQQAIEVLDTGAVTFPRENAEFLLQVKRGEVPMEELKVLLLKLDAEVLAKMETTTVRKKTPELVAEAERWLLSTTRELYGLEGPYVV